MVHVSHYYLKACTVVDGGVGNLVPFETRSREWGHPLHPCSIVPVGISVNADWSATMLVRNFDVTSPLLLHHVLRLSYPTHVVIPASMRLRQPGQRK